VVTVTVGPKAGALPAGSGGLRDAEFAEFFRAEHKKLIRFVIAIGADGDQAAEIAQVTFFKAFEGWDVIRAPRAWIRRVAVNELTAARQAARRETPQATLPDARVPVSTALAAELTEEAQQVLTALQALPPTRLVRSFPGTEGSPAAVTFDPTGRYLIAESVVRTGPTTKLALVDIAIGQLTQLNTSWAVNPAIAW
jgi:hypothetical protein